MSRLTIKSFQVPQPAERGEPSATTAPPAAQAVDREPPQAAAPSAARVDAALSAATADPIEMAPVEAAPIAAAPAEAPAPPVEPHLDPALRPFLEYLPAFEETEGWFAVESAAIWDSLLDLQRQQNWSGNLLEIGVYKGKSAALLGAHMRGNEQLFLADRFLLEDEVTTALSKVRPMPNPRVHLMREDSMLLDTQADLAGLEKSFRYIHIDGEHSAAALINDLDLAHRFGSRDVLVSVDDIFQFVYPQLTEALFRYLRDHPERFSLVLIGFNKAYLARPNREDDYLRHIAEEMGPRLERLGIETTISKSSYKSELNAFGIGPRLECGPTRGLDGNEMKIVY